MKRILCIYATRQVDSNLMMASTIFRGLHEAGYSADIIFIGSTDAISEFEKRYAQYFYNCFYKPICGPLKENILFRWNPLLYSYLRSFVLDGLVNRSSSWLKDVIFRDYDKILSFIPSVLSGRFALNVKRSYFKDVPLIQFWTDPLSLGRLNDITEIPKSRIFHKQIEHNLLDKNEVTKVVFCYPLLMAMEAKLHPDAAHKMSWSDVSYLPHKKAAKPKHARPLIGLFGAYQSHVRNIEPLLNAIRLLPDYDFIIRGDGDLPFSVDTIRNLDLESGRISLAEVEQLESSCDILLSLGGKSGITHPAGKTFYYADYDKPIVHIGDGMHAEYFKGYIEGFEGRFIHCYNSTDSIIDGINQAVRDLSNFQLRIPKRMDAATIVNKILELD